jgi:hypothetical protein
LLFFLEVSLGLFSVQLTAASFRWEQGEGFRSAALPILEKGKPGFTLMPASVTGITFSNILSDAKIAENQIRLNGSGVACGDVDEDGWCDVYFCGLENGNKLYRNLGGWKFEDITDEAGVACAGQYSTGAVFADVDGDGHLDLLVNGLGTGTRLFLNDGKGHFHELEGGLIHKFAATTLALADVDGDGYLDLYVANYRTTTIRTTGLAMLRLNGKLAIRPEDKDDYELSDQGLILESGEPHVLYRNVGHGNFQALSWTNGTFLDEEGHPLTKPPRDWGLTVAFRDLNGDRAPDLYVCNDFHTPDRVWLNDGQGHFRALPRLALRNTSTFSMAIDFADINRDGYDDFIDVDMLGMDHQQRMVQFTPLEPAAFGPTAVFARPQVNRNTLQLNRGDGTYAEIAYLSGLEASGWTWSTVFLDVDLDGYEDLLMSTGQRFDTQDLDAEERIDAMGPLGKERLPSKILMHPPLALPRVAFRNLGNLRFEECSARWGFNDVGISHGMALADLDNDGDLDVIMNSLNAPARLYRNDAGAPRIAVRLNGAAPNTRGVGARIIVRGGAVPVQSQEMMCGGRYLSGDDNLRVFAAGSPTNRLSLEVLWRSGRNSVLTNLAPDRIYEVEEDASKATLSTITSVQPSAMFEDVSHLIGSTHHEEPFDDFERQPLLPKKLSQLGPGVCWCDLNGDGWDDLAISGGKGGSLNVLLNDGKGGFRRSVLAIGPRVLDRDQTTVLGYYQGSGLPSLLVGSASYEDGKSERACVDLFGAGKVIDMIAGTDASVGPLSLGDLHGDGHLVLFVGGRVKPGRYPEAVSSRIFQNHDGTFQLDEPNSNLLQKVGLVSGAVWSDLDGDGFPELILACEWGPLRIFHNNHGHLSVWDPPVRLPAAPDQFPFALAASADGKGASTGKFLPMSSLTGWWNGVAVGDFDGDGKMDIVASNWGRNSKYEYGRRQGQPLRVYFGDFNGDGAVQLLDGYYDSRLKKEVPWRTLAGLARGLPWIRERYPTHAAYGAAGIAEILGEHFKEANVLEAQWLETTVFLNRDDHFEAVVLPGEAQFAPAFGVSVGDLDGDGKEDIFLSQNFFGVDDETTRYAAGRGVWLRGDGTGGFEVVPGQVSGIKVYGEGRGSALCDYDRDGRVDLVVGENAAETKLYHNIGAKPGLRVKLAGPPGNPTGVGAVIRLRFGQRWGAARELHAGSGYWSEDSALQVLGTPEKPTALWIRWPGGKTGTMPLPEHVRAITITLDGQLKVDE